MVPFENHLSAVASSLAGPLAPSGVEILPPRQTCRGLLVAMRKEFLRARVPRPSRAPGLSHEPAILCWFEGDAVPRPSRAPGPSHRPRPSAGALPLTHL